MTNIDMTKLLSKLIPDVGGEDVVRMRTGIVDSVNADGTVDLGIAGIIVPDIPYLAGMSITAGQVVNVISFRGSLLIIGSSASAAGTPLLPISTHMQAATADIAAPTVIGNIISVTGCVFAFTTTRANAVVMASIAIDWDPTNATNSGYQAYPRLDSTDILNPGLIFEVGSNTRMVTSREFRIPVATAGAHTLQARVIKNVGGANTTDIKATHTTISGVVYQPS